MISASSACLHTKLTTRQDIQNVRGQNAANGPSNIGPRERGGRGVC